MGDTQSISGLEEQITGRRCELLKGLKESRGGGNKPTSGRKRSQILTAIWKDMFCVTCCVVKKLMVAIHVMVYLSFLFHIILWTS